ncbi:MAG TPA: PEP-CTERM sorting domain-containing protein, partial [Duganella sp.]
MNYYKSGAVAALLSTALTAPVAAIAGPTIGLDATGTGTYTTYADLWTNITDTALVTGFVPGA